MNKNRVETISDGVFAIVMTLLIFDVKIPEVPGTVSNAELWILIGNLSPLIVSYALSFLVLSVFWINHHFIFHNFARSVNRQLNLLNMLYLMFLAFVPFSAHLLGIYYHHQPAVIVYGLNILAVVIMAALMSRYIRSHPELCNPNLSPRLISQGQIRTTISMVSYTAGILVSFVSVPLAIALFLFPVIFNIIPGSLDLFERLSGVEIG